MQRQLDSYAEALGKAIVRTAAVSVLACVFCSLFCIAVRLLFRAAVMELFNQFLIVLEVLGG